MAINKRLKKNLDRIIWALKKDWDCIILVDGAERSGKSVLAQQMAAYVDPSFNVDRVVFTSKDLVKTAYKLKPGQALVFDEALNGLGSKQAMSRDTQMIERALAEIGQLNLFIVIVLPSFYDLGKYAAVHRSQCLLHVYTKGLERGFFMFFSKRKKDLMYLNKYKNKYKYTLKSDFTGRFNKQYAVDEKEYRERKKEQLGTHFSNRKKEIPKKVRKKLYKEKCLEIVEKNQELELIDKKVELAALLGVTRQTIYLYEKELKEQQAKKKAKKEAILSKAA